MVDTVIPLRQTHGQSTRVTHSQHGVHSIIFRRRTCRSRFIAYRPNRTVGSPRETETRTRRKRTGPFCFFAIFHSETSRHTVHRANGSKTAKMFKPIALGFLIFHASVYGTPRRAPEDPLSDEFFEHVNSIQDSWTVSVRLNRIAGFSKSLHPFR